MISTFLPVHDADLVALDFGVFIAEQARTHRVSQTAIIAALRPCITPSQPEGSSSPHAPAAQTDGEGATPQAAPSVAPIPEAPKPLPDAPDNSADALLQPAEAKASEDASGESPSPDGGAVSAVKGANARLESADGAEPPPSPSLAQPAPPRARKETGRAKILATHAEHPDWPSKLIAEHLGIGEDAVRATASRKGVKLVSWWDYGRALKAKTRQELAAAVEKPMEAEKPSDEPHVEAKPDVPTLSLPSERLPPPPVKVVRTAPSGRFYLRDKVTGHFLHQSLEPASRGDGPMMTMDRKWAWYDTFDRYRGAKKRWPQIAEMRKEAVTK